MPRRSRPHLTLNDLCLISAGCIGILSFLLLLNITDNFSTILFSGQGARQIGIAVAQKSTSLQKVTPPKTVAPKTFPGLRSGDRLTIIAPHPDDEVIALGGLIARARGRQIPVSVIFMTNGDANYLGAVSQGQPTDQASMIAYGKMRQQEALAALKDLGVPSGSVYFLGLPNDGLTALLDPAYATAQYTSPSTGRSDSGAYDLSYIPQLPYTGQRVRTALLQVLNATRPTKLFMPMRDDYHPDHKATGEFAARILGSITTRPQHYSYLVHYPNFPRDDQPATTPLQPPSSLKAKPWDTIQLTSHEMAAKSQALHDYRSQIYLGGPAEEVARFLKPNELVIE